MTEYEIEINFLLQKWKIEIYKLRKMKKLQVRNAVINHLLPAYQCTHQTVDFTSVSCLISGQ